MRASAIEFRLRMWINTAIILLGFWAPWSGAWGPSARFAPHISLLEWLALRLSRAGVCSFATAAPVVIVAGSLAAALGAILRVWGTAWLGAGTVQSPEMKAGAVEAGGPYRYVRNPLYLGFWWMCAAVSLFMPPSGALAAMILITVFQLRLILGEEAFLAVKIGEPYLAYRRAVPRLLPRLRGLPAAADGRPQWLRSLVAELTPIGVFVAVAFVSWSYNNRLVVRVILIGFGASLVARALQPPGSPTAGQGAERAAE
jgi:protein-S-isoprenylcysteine O-methyltransferase Ste14